jgi:EAL domain-containing protein (putative c-di-GMP-specific phosphodiesterase class I)
VSNLEDDNAESKELVRTILSMASNLGLGVIAEGIENLASVDLLRRLGCNFGQGFYFSRAVNAVGAAAMLRESGGLSERCGPANVAFNEASSEATLR